MTTTPTIWKAEFTANAGITSGIQYDPVTIGLADGRFLTVWTDDANNVDDDPLTDIIGQIYSPQGNPVGAAFQLNQEDTGDDEGGAVLAALPDGGFALAYNSVGPALGANASILFERYNAVGAQTAGGTIAIGTIGGTINHHPSIALLADGDFVVSYQQTSAGDTDILARVVDADTNIVGGALTNAAQNSPDEDSLPNTIVLSNGNIVTVYNEVDMGVLGIEAQVMTPAGVFVSNLPIAGPAVDPHAAALTGGGFVVVWENAPNNGEIRAEVRNNNGGTVADDFLVQGGINAQNAPDVVALKDGGFFVAWSDDSADLLRGQRFSATGAAIGTVVTIAGATNLSVPELGLTDDGRILVTFSDAGDISQVILDPRDNVINGDDTSEAITSRVDGATVYGNGGSDMLIGQGTVDSLFGGTGNDVLIGGGGGDVLDGGNGTDTMIGGAAGDTYFVANVSDAVDETGGSGVDYVWAAVNFNLGSVLALGQVENLVLTGGTATTGVGNAFDNSILGNDTHNTLNGGDGNDTLIGGIGNDTLSGNNGADALLGQVGNDTLIGGQGNDRFVFNNAPTAANADTITDFANVVGINNDFFQLDNLAFAALGMPGAMNAALFFAGAAAHDADDRIVYNQASGALLYDNNGDAAGGIFQIAVLTTKPTLTAADFVVI
jgi:Ca2+-binding RTX toxin-like protein